MIVAITGTPGTGKTTVGANLKKKGFTVIDLKQVAIDNNYILGMDEKRDSKIVDTKKLDKYTGSITQEEVFFVEGHISHLLKNVDKVIILRLKPSDLKKILGKRGWNDKKVNENVEAEILDIILCESIDVHDEENCFEINTTGLSVDAVEKCILEIVENKFKNMKKYKIGKIDWSEEILKDK